MATPADLQNQERAEAAAEVTRPSVVTKQNENVNNLSAILINAISATRLAGTLRSNSQSDGDSAVVEVDIVDGSSSVGKAASSAKLKPEDSDQTQLPAAETSEKKTSTPSWRKNLLSFLGYLVAFSTGISTAVSSAVNGKLAIPLGSAIGAAFISFSVGTVILIPLFFLVGPRPEITATLKAPRQKLPEWYLWVGGGCLGGAFVALTAYLAPRVGFGLFFVVLATGQLSTSLLLDHITFLKALPHRPFTLMRVLGAIVALAGAAMTTVERIMKQRNTHGNVGLLVLYILLSFLTGAILAVQVGVNTAFTKRMGTLPHRTSLLSFFMGTITLAIVWGISIAISGQVPDFLDTEWWMYSGGPMAVFYVVSSVVLAPFLGVAVFLVSMIAGQLFMSLLLDAVGALGYPILDPTALRVAGVAVAFVGAVCIQFGDMAVQEIRARRAAKREGERTKC